MGVISHKAAVVTSFDDELMEEARDKALELFDDGLVTGIIPSKVNSYKTFFISPCGSKVGWEEDNEHKDALDAFYEWINSMRHEDGSSSIEYVEVEFGEKGTRVNKSVDDFS